LSDTKFEHSDITKEIIGAAMEVHSQLGCGFLESVYEEALVVELGSRNIEYKRQKDFKVLYKGRCIKQFKCDLIIKQKVLVEIKALTCLSGAEESQVLNYLKASGLKIGLLINFGEKSLKFKRFAN